MRIATFNANSIRVREEIVVEWMAEHEPDVLAIQEIKCEDDLFPRDTFEEMGYQLLVHGQKSYNGVAILSRGTGLDVQMGYPDPSWPRDCRILAATIEGIRVINTYVPNGTKVGSDKFEYKLNWLEKFADWIQAEMARYPNLIWLGDINIAPQPEDVYDSAKVKGGVGHHPKEFEALEKIVKLGLADVFRKFETGPGHFTFWEFVVPQAVKRNIGWRIDHIYATPSLADQCKQCWIDKAPRLLERPSDHTFVIADFSV